jgi:hypothetical protein
MQTILNRAHSFNLNLIHHIAMVLTELDYEQDYEIMKGNISYLTINLCKVSC